MSRLPKAGVYFAYGQNFNDRESGLRALNNMAKLLKKLHHEYPTFAAYLGLSNVDGKSAERINIHQGKVGRPKIGFQKKPGVKKSIWKKYHIHIVIVGEYAATVAKKFCEIMSERYEAEKDSKHLKGNAFIDEKAKWDGYYSMLYFANQAQNCRFVGDKELLAKFDRSSAKKEQAQSAELYFPKKRGIGVEPRDLCPKINDISAAPEEVNSVL